MECMALGGQRGHAGTKVRLWVIYGALAGPYRHYSLNWTGSVCSGPHLTPFWRAKPAKVSLFGDLESIHW